MDSQIVTIRNIIITIIIIIIVIIINIIILKWLKRFQSSFGCISTLKYWDILFYTKEEKNYISNPLLYIHILYCKCYIVVVIVSVARRNTIRIRYLRPNI
jgi:hypothetical protein